MTEKQNRWKRAFNFWDVSNPAGASEQRLNAFCLELKEAEQEANEKASKRIRKNQPSKDYFNGWEDCLKELREALE